VNGYQFVLSFLAVFVLVSLFFRIGERRERYRCGLICLRFAKSAEDSRQERLLLDVANEIVNTDRSEEEDA
jgi:hypothetical protein